MLFWRLRDLRIYSHAAIGIAVLALLGVDATVAGVRSGDAAQVVSIGGHEPHSRPIGRVAYADAVTSGHGVIWTLHCSRHAGRHCEVALGSPPKGVEASVLAVPRPASHLFYGAGRVWIAGGGRISAIDPRTHRIATLRLAGGTVASMAFRGSRAYAAVVGRDEVLAITPGRTLHPKVIAEHGGPRTVIAFPDAIEVANDEMNLVPIIFPRADTSFLAALQLGRPVIAAAGPHAAWVRRGRQLVRETLGPDNRPARKYIATPGRALRVVMAAGGGCYVSLASVRRRGIDLAYFSRKALSARHPTPTDVHVGRRVVDFALNPAGGVVYIDRTGALQRWVPAA